jgi:hypothetical protein
MPKNSNKKRAESLGNPLLPDEYEESVELKHEHN